MNKVLNVIQKHKILTGIIALIALFVFTYIFSDVSPQKSNELSQGGERTGKVEKEDEVIEEEVCIQRPYSEFLKLEATEEAIKTGTKKAKESLQENVIEPTEEMNQIREGTYRLPPLELFHCTEMTLKKEAEEEMEEAVPQGRMITCQLITTLRSFNTSTPILGIVTENLYWGGKLIIPAGVEVHGQTQPNFRGDRIFANGEWLFVWGTKDEDNGKTLKLSGQVLNREKDLLRDKWGIEDMSGGIKGEVIETTNLEEIKMFLAKFAGAFSEGLKQKETIQTPLGITEMSASTMKNAAFNGIGDVMNGYAQKMMNEIKEQGKSVIVPAGTQFYLYVTQPIDQQMITRRNIMKWKETEKEERRT